MNNFFSRLEEDLLLKEGIIFDEEIIRKEVRGSMQKKIGGSSSPNFAFEDLIYDFFDYLRIPLIRTGRTRDSGIDGIIKLKMNFLGEVNVGLQIKNKKIDSTDIDLFLSALNLAEIKLGTIVCEDSRNLDKYDLNSKIKTILLSRGIGIKENLINEKISINPVFVMKLGDVVGIVASQVRNVAKAIYKK